MIIPGKDNGTGIQYESNELIELSSDQLGRVTLHLDCHGRCVGYDGNPAQGEIAVIAFNAGYSRACR